MSKSPSRTVPQACFLCLKEGGECDLQRPCGRCKGLNVPHMCFGVELNQKTPHSGTAHSHSAASAPNSSTPKDDKLGPYGANKKRKRADLSVEIQTYGNMTPQSPNNNSISAPPPIGPGFETKEDMMKINVFLMQEIRKIKQDQLRMQDEVSYLRHQNDVLIDKLNKLSVSGSINNLPPPTPNAALPAGSNAAPNSATSAHNRVEGSMAQMLATDRAMVVFDLIKSPAIVLTANEHFCQLFGYKLEEVIGMPWKKFIHPDYLERTTAILRQKNLQAAIQFTQVYRNSEGMTFVALDTHSFFFGNHGTPRADLVTVQPLQPSLQTALPSPASRHYWPVSGSTQGTLAGQPPSALPNASGANVSQQQQQHAQHMQSPQTAQPVTGPFGIPIDVNAYSAQGMTHGGHQSHEHHEVEAQKRPVTAPPQTNPPRGAMNTASIEPMSPQITEHIGSTANMTITSTQEILDDEPHDNYGNSMHGHAGHMNGHMTHMNPATPQGSMSGHMAHAQGAHNNHVPASPVPLSPNVFAQSDRAIYGNGMFPSMGAYDATTAGYMPSPYMYSASPNPGNDPHVQGESLESLEGLDQDDEIISHFFR
jgi:PAS domain S-box-containing protein